MSLAAHLRGTQGHGALRFRRDCPICRCERLAGPLPPGEPAVPARLKAGLVATVLAGSAVAPAAAAAQDQGPPIELPPPAALDNLPDEEVPPAQQEAQPDPAEVLLGNEPGSDEGAPAEDEGSPLPGEAPVPDSDPDAPAPPAPPPPKPAPPAPPPKKPSAHQAPRHRSAPPAPRRPRPAAPAPAPSAPAPAGPVQPGPPASAPPPPAPPPPSGHGYAVRSGDTLWSIARSLLGPGASPAQIARKVDQLWRLNAGHIHSGRPDLILPGERLRLS
jgi:hypothetical protein